MAVANGRATTPEKSTTISPQSVSLDTPIAAQGKGHGRHGRSHGYRHGRSRHGHGRGWFGPGYGYWGYGGYGYGGGYWPGGYGGYSPGYGGYWRGGFGCNFDYPCGPPFDEQCRSFRGAPAADPKCQAQQTQPAPGQSAQPTPDTGTQPAPAPAPEQGGTQPRPY